MLTTFLTFQSDTFKNAFVQPTTVKILDIFSRKTSNINSLQMDLPEGVVTITSTSVVMVQSNTSAVI